MTFRVGQKVACADAENHGRYSPWLAVTGLDGLAQDAIYTIRSIGLYRDVPCLWLEEITRPIFRDETVEAGFHILRFRPIVARKAETDISFAHEILREASRKETVRA